MIAASPQWAYRLSAACFKAALIHLRLKTLEEKFDPRQPRVPAGHPDGGQWTDDPRFGGGALYRDQLLRRVQFGKDARYRVRSIESHEGIEGSHTLQHHVAKSFAYLERRMTEPKRVIKRTVGNTITTIKYYRGGSSSFHNVLEATGFVNATLAENKLLVDAVASGKIPVASLTKEFNRTTGYGFVRNSEPIVIGGKIPKYRLGRFNGVRVIIMHNPNMRFGYHIITSHPVELRGIR